MRIERNTLPPVQALWPVQNHGATVAQLLQHVNEIFPLEADTWGLEDYALSVDGFDCLHYHELRAVCKDEDEVVIRPLQYADIRARARTGRDQIARDGRHLVDGVPFGRPCLRPPVRPELTIPPRKRVKLLEDETLLDEISERELPYMLTERGEEEIEIENRASKNEVEDEDDDDDEEDADFEAESDVSTNAFSSEEAILADSSEDPSSSDSDSDGRSSDDVSDTDSASDSASDSATSQSGISNAKIQNPNQISESNLDDGITGVLAAPAKVNYKRRRKMSEDANEHNVGALENVRRPKTVKLVQAQTRPYEGTTDTKQRNVRRRDTKRLGHLKRVGVLPLDSTLETYRTWLAEQELRDIKGPATDKLDITPATHVSVAGADDAQESQVSTMSTKAATLEKARQELLASIALGGVDITDTSAGATRPGDSLMKEESDEAPEELSTRHEHVTNSESNSETISKPLLDKASAMMMPPSIARRSRLDLAGSKRLLFASLGARVPKTELEKAQLQKKLAARASKNTKLEDTSLEQINSGSLVPTASDRAEPARAEMNEDPEAWRQKIHLTAIECCEEGVTLSTPPFPFHQRWDPQQRKKKTAKRVDPVYINDGSKKRKRGKKEPEAMQETYDKYNLEEGDSLEYDDVGAEDEYWEADALLNGAYDDYDAASGEAEANDGKWPALPTDMEELPTVIEQFCHEGDIITFPELACDENTGWEPKMVHRTAEVLWNVMSSYHCLGDRLDGETPLSPFVVQLAPRDLKPKVYDEDGNRRYSKFEMPEEEGEDEGRRETTFAELGDVRRVRCDHGPA